MNCQELDVLAYVKGELSEDDKARTKSHVAYCASCTNEVERTRGMLRLLQTEEWIQPSPKFVDRVMAAYDVDMGEAPSNEPLLKQLLNALLGRTKQQGMSWAVSISVHVILFGVLTLFVAVQTTRPPDDLVIMNPPTVDQPAKVETIDKAIPLPGDQTGVGRRIPPTELPIPWDKVERTGPTDPKDELPKIVRPVRPPPVEEEPRRIYNQVMYESRDMMAAVESYRKDRKARDTRMDPQGKYRETINKAHDWLASKQDPKGKWAAVNQSFNPTYEVGVTGLVLLSFLSEGHSAANGKHSDVVRKGVDYLIQQQREQGYYGDNKGNWLYNHMIATMAMMENHNAVREDKDFDRSMKDAYRESVHRAVHFIGWAQGETGGWAYEPHQPDTDIHVTTWAIMALRMAMNSGLRDLAVMPLIKAKSALAKLLLPDDKYSYRLMNQAQFGWQGPTAMGMAGHVFSSFAPDKSRLEKQADMLSKENLLSTRGAENKTNNLMALFFSAMALHHLQGPAWEAFWKTYPPALVGLQDKSGSFPIALERQDLAEQGGQYYVTAIVCLTLQTYNRFPPLN